MPDVQQHGYRAYPLADHIADKACAIFERHGPTGTPSTRYRDLVDLVAIVLSAPAEAEPHLTALRSEAQWRGLQLPGRFVVLDQGLWQRGYTAETGRSLLARARTLNEAIAMVTPFLDPLLDGSTRGRWDPQKGAAVLGRWCTGSYGRRNRQAVAARETRVAVLARGQELYRVADGVPGDLPVRPVLFPEFHLAAQLAAGGRAHLIRSCAGDHRRCVHGLTHRVRGRPGIAARRPFRYVRLEGL
jgi:hypothetical protein